jgi:ACS family hexuronate transporter-like MFS transporter
MDPAQPTSTSGILASQAQAGAATTGESALPNVPSRLGYFRWVICGLLLLGTTKNYMDRNVLGVLRVTLQHELGWNEIDYGNLVVFF